LGRLLDRVQYAQICGLGCFSVPRRYHSDIISELVDIYVGFFSTRDLCQICGCCICVWCSLLIWREAILSWIFESRLTDSPAESAVSKN